jgi:hypothetical protein
MMVVALSSSSLLSWIVRDDSDDDLKAATSSDAYLTALRNNVGETKTSQNAYLTAVHLMKQHTLQTNSTACTSRCIARTC